MSLQTGLNRYIELEGMYQTGRPELTTRIHTEDTDLFILQLLAETFDKHHSSGVRLAICDHRVIGLAVLRTSQLQSDISQN